LIVYYWCNSIFKFINAFIFSFNTISYISFYNQLLFRIIFLYANFNWFYNLTTWIDRYNFLLFDLDALYYFLKASYWYTFCHKSINYFKIITDYRLSTFYFNILRNFNYFLLYLWEIIDLRNAMSLFDNFLMTYRNFFNNLFFYTLFYYFIFTYLNGIWFPSYIWDNFLNLFKFLYLNYTFLLTAYLLNDFNLFNLWNCNLFTDFYLNWHLAEFLNNY